MDKLIVHSDPKIMHGKPVFVGTRVPAVLLWDNLEAGTSLDEFLDNYPTVKREQALGLLAKAQKLLPEPTIVRSDPEIMHGAPVFVGTRVPAQNLWDHLEAGDSLNEFLEGFPGVSRKQAVGLLRQARELLSGPTPTTGTQAPKNVGGIRPSP